MNPPSLMYNIFSSSMFYLFEQIPSVRCDLKIYNALFLVLSFFRISRASSKGFSFARSVVFSLRFRLSIFLSSSTLAFLHFSSSFHLLSLPCYLSLCVVELSSSLHLYVAASSLDLLSRFFV